MKNFGFLYLCFLVLIILWNSCANPGTPTGGPKDELPPKVRKSVPASGALNFKGKEISIYFDELIQLKDVNQKLVVSPPLNKQPTVVSRGSELSIEFNEDLQENTTYTLDFADAISDNNEGNILENFRFSFSTGDTVDSLSISGHLYDSENLAPTSGALVFIHENLSDTAFKKLVPVRLAKTNEKGAFTILNVRPGNYHLYALNDMNSNYKFDQAGERIAWLDSLVVPGFNYLTVADTIKGDNLSADSVRIDSVAVDSIVYREVLHYIPDSLQLFMFSDPVKEQYIKDSERKEKACLNFYFGKKADSVTIKPLLDNVMADWAIMEYSSGRDSLSVWLRDTTLISNDSIPVEITYSSVDSLLQPIVKNDTLTFYYFGDDQPKKEDKKKKKDKEVDEIPSVNIKDLKSTIDIFGRLTMSFDAAPVEFDADGIHLVQLVDSIATPVDHQLIKDSLSVRRFYIDRNWEPGGVYELQLDSAMIRDVYGKVNKPMKFKTTVNKEDAYATIYLTVENPADNWLVQILNSSNESVARQAKVPANGKIAFRLIKPAEYVFRIVVDVNANGRWDSGDFLLKRQPETVLYYPEKVSVRANWDHTIKWSPSDFNIYQFTESFRNTSKSGKSGKSGNSGSTD